jgi:hypothetical protein
MNTGALYRAAVEAEGRIMATLTRRRYAENDVKSRGLAYDSSASDAIGVYTSALGQLGIPADELAGLSSFHMEKMLRAMPGRGARARRPEMAFDAKACSKLDSILGGVAPPVDLTER